MKVVGLIAEYNPFHSGHLFHIQEAKRLSHADYVLIVISGDFVQRGAPALLDKYARAEMALLCGADAVFELPVRFSCASAEFFACGSVFLLDQLGVTDFLCFGSECGNLNLLWSAAQYLTNESFSFQKKIQFYIKQGLSYPAARTKAFFEECSAKSSFKEISSQDLSALLSEPNNILAIEYLKALNQIQSRILPLTYQRKEAGYHDKTLYQTFASATALRNKLLSNPPKTILPYIPEAAFPVLEREYLRSFPITSNDFSLPLYYKIRSSLEQNIPLSLYQDISPDLEARIGNQLKHFTSFEAFALLLKTRQYTLTRINRCLFHILLDIKKPLPVASNSPVYSFKLPPHLLTCMPSYARLLGFRKSSSALLSAIKKHSAIPLITKLADAQNILCPAQHPDLKSQNPSSSQKNSCFYPQHTDPKDAFFFLKQDCFAADLYQKTQELKFHTTQYNEFTHPLILLP